MAVEPEPCCEVGALTLRPLKSKPTISAPVISITDLEPVAAFGDRDVGGGKCRLGQR